jgi:hypothetical protein
MVPINAIKRVTPAPRRNIGQFVSIIFMIHSKLKSIRILPLNMEADYIILMQPASQTIILPLADF